MHSQNSKAGRGDATRDAILTAAMEIFGRDGFGAASTRAIALAAQVNQALIGYHFGNKERLYLTVFEHIASRMESLMGPTLEAIEAKLVQGATATTAAPLLMNLVNGFTAMLLRDETAQWVRLILREQQAPSEAFDILYQRIIGRGLAMMTSLIASIRGHGEATESDRLSALTVMGQVLIFRAARAAAMRHLDWQHVSDDRVAAIQQQITSNVAAMLNLHRAEGRAP
jgi:AcrR family transcriptional regulator